MSKKIISLVDHPDFKIEKVYENYDPSTKRKIRRLIRTSMNLPEFRVAAVDNELLSKFKEDNSMDVKPKIKYDIYVNTQNVDKYNKIYEYIYNRTEKG